MTDIIDSLLDLPEVGITSTPPNDGWSLYPLVKRMKSGKIHVWIAAYFDKTTYTLGGKLAITDEEEYEYIDLKVASSNDVILKSAKNYSSQGMTNLRAKWSKKLNSGWTKLDDWDPNNDTMLEPMLASSFKESRIKYYPVSVQCKLNGHRAMTYLKSGKVEMVSRSGTKYYFLEEVRDSCRKLLYKLPEGTILDGELYIHGQPRNIISSQLRTTSDTSKKLNPPEQEDLVQYYIFDLITKDKKLSHDKRYKLLDRAFNICNIKEDLTGLMLVNTIMANSKEEIDDIFKRSIEGGFEGAIVRLLRDGKGNICSYEHGRTTKMMKIKHWIEKEVEIVEVFESTSGAEREKGAGMFNVDFNGLKCPVRPAATYEERKEWLINPELVVGRIITVKFESVNPDSGYPQQLTMSGFRDYGE